MCDVRLLCLCGKKWGKLNINIPTKEEKKENNNNNNNKTPPPKKQPPIRILALHSPQMCRALPIISVTSPFRRLRSVHHPCSFSDFIIALYILYTNPLFVYMYTCDFLVLLLQTHFMNDCLYSMCPTTASIPQGPLVMLPKGTSLMAVTSERVTATLMCSLSSVGLSTQE